VLAVNPDNAVELTAKNIDIHMTADFTFKYIITVKGTADINIKGVALDLEMGLSTQTGTPSYDIAPMLTVVKDTISINPDNVDIKLSGSLVAKIASLLVPLIKSSLIPSIVKTVQETIDKTITTSVDPDLQLYGTQINIPYLADVTVDYGQMVSGPVVTSDSVLEMALNGTFFDQGKPLSTLTPAVFPLRNPTGKAAQGYVTDYVVNTVL
jgi:hypothetical protein